MTYIIYQAPFRITQNSLSSPKSSFLQTLSTTIYLILFGILAGLEGVYCGDAFQHDLDL